jgi:cobalt-zinc-cadmium efflux system outer membrane protein
MRTISTFIFMMLLYFSAGAQVLKLDSLLKQVEKNNLTLQAYSAKIEALNAYALGAKNWEAPLISGGLWMTPYNMQKDMGMAMFSIQQMIPNPAKLNARQDYMRGLSSVETENKKYMKNQLDFLARSNYFDWVILKKKSLLLKETTALLKFMIQSAENGVKYEKNTISSVYKAQANLYESDNLQMELDQEIKQKNLVINALLNLNQNTVLDVDTVLNFKEAQLLQADTTALRSNRSDLKAIEQNIRILKLTQAMESNKRKPDFGIRYDHMNSFGNQANLFTLMGMITVPIAPWASREYKANIKGAELDINTLELQKKSLLKEAEGKLLVLKEAIKTKTMQVQNFSKNLIPAVSNQYKVGLLAYSQNTESISEVLDALQRMQTTRMEHLNKLQELLQLQAELIKEAEHE